MVKTTIRTVQANCFSQHRPALDPSMRRLIHGPIRPMTEPGIIERIFHWR